MFTFNHSRWSDPALLNNQAALIPRRALLGWGLDELQDPDDPDADQRWPALLEDLAYSGDRDRSFRLNVTAAHEMVVRD